jgi:hypothetical protein
MSSAQHCYTDTREANAPPTGVAVVQPALSENSAPVLRISSASCLSGVLSRLLASHLAVLQLHRRGSLLL